MNTTSLIAVIGGTGKSGSYLSRELIKQGRPFRILLRNPQKFPSASPLATLVQGDARDPEAIRRLLEGCTAVVSMLGQPKGEPSIFSQATAHVLQAMAEHNMRRYILTTGLSVDAPNDHKSESVQAATAWMKSHYPETTSDKQAEYALLQSSTIDWTMIRLPMIEQTEDCPPIQVSLTDCPGDKISAGSLARFALEQLAESRFIRQAPFIANASM